MHAPNRNPVYVPSHLTHPATTDNGVGNPHNLSKPITQIYAEGKPDEICDIDIKRLSICLSTCIGVIVSDFCTRGELRR